MGKIQTRYGDGTRVEGATAHRGEELGHVAVEATDAGDHYDPVRKAVMLMPKWERIMLPAMSNSRARSTRTLRTRVSDMMGS